MYNKIYQNDSDWELPIQEIIKKLEVTTKAYFDRCVEEYQQDLLFAISDCESPIERLFGLALEKKKQYFEILSDQFSYCVDQQKEVIVNSNTYRIDFSICIQINSIIYKMAIECDGHDFHEKSKAQALRDKKRDRDLTTCGYIVMHFTGSEIYSAPDECVNEILKFLQSR